MTENPSARKQEAADPFIGRTIGEKFKIVSLVARGGMGRVYKAEQAPLGRICAVKVVSAGMAGMDPEFQRRFFLEASTAAKLRHPNTVTVFDYGKTDEEAVFYMAMELLEGRTLHRALREDGVFPELRAIHIASQICRSVREAHELGVIHRDLKPANVFLVHHADEQDFVKVLDFGLVKHVEERPEDALTQTGLFMGSPKYMAPEQIEGNRVDARTDMYSLGIILYEMLTGKVPFERSSSVQTLLAHVHDAVPPFPKGPKEVSVVLQNLVFRCLSKDPADRFASIDELLAGLKTAVAEISGLAPRTTLPSIRVPLRSDPPPDPGLPSRTVDGQSMDPEFAPSKSRRPVALGLVSAVLALGAVGFFVHRMRAPGTHASVTIEMPLAPSSATVSTKPSQAVPVTVRVTSDPPGALVTLPGGEILCDTTPCETTPRADAGTLMARFSKAGFRAESAEVPKAGALHVTLGREGQAKWPSRLAEPKASAVPVPSAMPGFKAEPY